MGNCMIKGKGSFYIAQYPVRWTAQSALHCLPSQTDLFIPTPFSASPVSRFECVSGLSVYPVEIRSVNNLSSSEDCSTDYCQPV